MAQLNFDANAYAPATVGGAQFPVSDEKGWLVRIVESELTPTKDGNNGYLKLTLEGLEGEAHGIRGVYRLNLYHSSAKTVEIAQRQLSAICHVTGVFRIQDTAQLHGIPFRAVVGKQKKVNENDPDYTEVKGVKDLNGNDPGKGGAPSATAPAQTAPAGWQQPQAPAAPATPPPPPAASAAPAWGQPGTPPQAPAQASSAPWQGQAPVQPAAPLAPAQGQPWDQQPGQAPAPAPWMQQATQQQ